MFSALFYEAPLGTPSKPPEQPTLSSESGSAWTQKRRRTHPSGGSGTNVEAVPGPVQFKLRTPEAI
eukprot:3947082-Alexandrium_andersonii.AAC.1